MSEYIEDDSREELLEQLLTKDYEENWKLIKALERLRVDAGPYLMLSNNYAALKSSRDSWKKKASEYEKLAKRNAELADELLEQIRDSFTEYKAALEAYEYVRKYADEMCVPLPCDADGVIWKGNETEYEDEDGEHLLSGFVWDGKGWRIFYASYSGIYCWIDVDLSTVRHKRKDGEEMGVTESVADIFNKVDWSEHGGNIGRRKVLDALYEIGINVEEFNHGKGIWH